ncbi:uncharacterized protein LOC121381875 [Gigantopelta aegis]|uniref:uncharacterized protein LOC121381875 n=1 Tax=Gigantopelta aegis TaxID=1735272 RepID=UPI001B88CF78|nr:uncharacterized protein LOC121381875 [Gigantopelta aegis]
MKKNDKQTEAASGKHEKSRRQLDFEKKKKPRSLSKKVFYLDIKDARRMRSLEGKLKQLGGTIEKFLSKEVNYIITSNAHLSKQKQDKQGGTGDSPNTTNASTPSPFNLGQSPSPNAIAELKKIENVPRGKTLAKIAGGQQSPNTVLENAEKIGIKVVSYEQTIKYVEKEIAKLKVIPETSKQVTKKKPSTSRNKVQMLKAPFVKFESESCHYRPIMQELESWPHLNVETPRGTCPFDGRPLGHAQCSERAERDMNAERIMSPDTPNTPKCPGLDTLNTPQDEVKRTCGRVNEDSTSKLLGFPILTAGEVRRDREKKRRAARRQGYCEACKEKYNDIDQHLMGEHHKQFVRNKANFMKLDRLIESGPSTPTFISSVILRHCVLKAQEKPKSQSSGGILQHETIRTDESEFKMDQMQTPKKKVVSLNLNQNPLETGDNGTHYRNMFKENVLTMQPLQMIEMSQICPKHKKDRSLCRCTDVLSSLGRQLAQSCSPNHTAQRHTRESNDLRNVNLHSAAVVKNPSCRGLYGSPTRLGLRKSFQKSSKQEMVIGNSQIASLQTVQNVYNSYSNIQVSSNSESSDGGDISDNYLPETEVKPAGEDHDVQISANHDLPLNSCTSTVLGEKPVTQQSKDCRSKSLAKNDKVHVSSHQDTNRESNDLMKKCFVEKEKSMPVSLKSSSEEKNPSLASKDLSVHSSDMVQQNETECSLQTADFIMVNEDEKCKLNKIPNELLLKHQTISNNRPVSKQVSSQNLTRLDEKQTTEFRSEIDELQTSVESSNTVNKEKSTDCSKAISFSKYSELQELSPQKLQQEKPVIDHVLFCQSAAERVKNRRAKSTSSASNNTPNESVCYVSESDHSSQQHKHKHIAKTNTEKTVVKCQKHKSRHWSGLSSKPVPKENDFVSHSIDSENVQKSKLKKHLKRLKLNETQVNSNVEHNNDDQNVAIDNTNYKEIILEKESKGLSVGSLSPKYKKHLSRRNKHSSKKNDLKTRVDNDKVSSWLSRPASPVFKTSPRYCKKTKVPISPISFNISATKTVRKKEKPKMKPITKHRGFLRTPGNSARSIKLKEDKASKEKQQSEGVKQLYNNEQANGGMFTSPNISKQNEDCDQEWDSPKSGFSTTPCGKSLATRKLYSLDDTFKCKSNKKRRLKLTKSEMLYDVTKMSAEIQLPEKSHEPDDLAAGVDTNISPKLSVEKSVHGEPSGEIIKLLSPVQSRNCLKAKNTSLSNSSFCENVSREVLGKAKKRKWSGSNMSTSMKPGSSTKKIKLNRSWLILSERSMGKLLESEPDPPSFHGYNKQMSESKLPSDLTYEELSEIELSDDSDKEWVIEDCVSKNKNRTLVFKSDTGLEDDEDDSFNELVPLFTSPGKATDSSWGDACDSFLKTTCNKLSTSHTCSTPFNVDTKRKKKKTVKTDKSSSQRKRSKLKEKTDNKDAVHVPNCVDPTTPIKHRHSKKIELKDLRVKQVDEDIVFNFCSPQKDKREFSPLRNEDTYTFSGNQYVCGSSQTCQTTPSKLEEKSSPRRHKSKDDKSKRQYSHHGGKNASKVKKSIGADFEDVKRTSSKLKRERFS